MRAGAISVEVSMRMLTEIGCLKGKVSVTVLPIKCLCHCRHQSSVCVTIAKNQVPVLLSPPIKCLCHCATNQVPVLLLPRIKCLRQQSLPNVLIFSTTLLIPGSSRTLDRARYG